MFAYFFDVGIGGRSPLEVLEAARRVQPELELRIVARDPHGLTPGSAAYESHAGMAISDGESYTHIFRGGAISDERRIHDDGRVECGDVMYYRDDGSPSRRLCGGCSQLSDRGGIERPEGCGDVLERDSTGDRPMDQAVPPVHQLRFMVSDRDGAEAAATVLRACMAPFGSLPSAQVDDPARNGANLARSIVRWTTSDELELGAEILRMVRATDASQCSSIELGDYRAALITPTSGTRIEIRRYTDGWRIAVDFGARGSRARAATIELAAEQLGVAPFFLPDEPPPGVSVMELGGEEMWVGTGPGVK